jgi:hypothetical protein
MSLDAARPVDLTIDEAELIVSVARYALRQLGEPDPLWYAPKDGCLRTVMEMRSINLRSILPVRRSISRTDLEFLAPYIEEWINGKAPPQNLPAEYEDWRPATLSEFKKRMIKEGLWPVGH